jgi:hypothetical protein
MNNRENSAGRILLSGLAAMLLGAAAIALAVPRQAQATPQFAAQTGKPCAQCHVNPTGGALNAYGKEFKANGNKLPKKK